MGDAGAKLTFLATGSEVGLAMQARAAAGQGRHPLTHSLHALLGLVRGTEPDNIVKRCWVPARSRSPSKRRVRQGWDRYIGADGGFIGMHSFGASGPAKDVYKHFHITPEAAAEAAKTALSKR